MQNLEIKIDLTSFDEIFSALKQINAEFIDILEQKDIYYRNSKGLLKLRRVNEEYEFIFYDRDESAENRWSNYSILKIADPYPEEFFDKIFEKEIIVEKTRKLYLYKNTRIHLDSVNNLGDFLELETVVVNGQESAKEEFDFVYDSLSLSNYKELRTSYRDLLLAL
ncbi:MAG: class IV adenylate cyclase [Melioribacteraceae bacterium]|nr:class IV adenylate cyclase [Melioribacteraceae bacterium]